EHPLILKMLEKVNAKKQSELDDSVTVLFESTAIASGFAVGNPHDFAKKVEQVVRQRLGVDLASEPNVKIVPAPDVVEADEKVDHDEEEVEGHDEL
ncbi:hypothetical protein HKX48_001076, partial [Thoreauomyces humboldtii]